MDGSQDSRINNPTMNSQDVVSKMPESDLSGSAIGATSATSGGSKILVIVMGLIIISLLIVIAVILINRPLPTDDAVTDTSDQISSDDLTVTEVTQTQTPTITPSATKAAQQKEKSDIPTVAEVPLTEEYLETGFPGGTKYGFTYPKGFKISFENNESEALVRTDIINEDSPSILSQISWDYDGSDPTLACSDLQYDSGTITFFDDLFGTNKDFDYVSCTGGDDSGEWYNFEVKLYSRLMNGWVWKKEQYTEKQIESAFRDFKRVVKSVTRSPY